MGNNHYIHKKGSPILRYFFNKVKNILDKKFEDLKNNPFMDYRDFKGRKFVKNG